MRERIEAAFTTTILLVSMALPADGQCPEAKLAVSGIGDSALLGSIADLEGNVAVLGSRTGGLGGAGGFADGAVYVFERTGSDWVETARLVPIDPVWISTGETFVHSASLNEGRILVTAAPTAQGPDTGFLFEKQGSSWVQTEILRPSVVPSSVIGDTYAALHGDTVMFARDGVVHVFEQLPGGWTEVQTLQPSNTQFATAFGITITLSDYLAIVSAVYFHGGISVSGSAFVYEWQGAGWVETAILTASDPTFFDGFGRHAALLGEPFVQEILIGAPRNDGCFLCELGAVYSFTRQGSTWVESQKITANDPLPGSEFGHVAAAAPDGDWVLVGAPGEQAVYLFHREPAGWVEVDRFGAGDSQPGDGFGPLRFDGTTALVTAVGDDDQGSDSGGAYLFDVHTEQSLFGCPRAVPIGPGGKQELSLRAGAGQSGAPYVLLGSATGSVPGTAIDSVVLPLVPDAYTTYLLQNPNTSILAGAVGVLDESGVASAELQVPAGVSPSLVGTFLTHAYVTFDFQGPIPSASLASNPVFLELALCDDVSLVDCNANGVADGCEILNGSAPDCNGNGIPDECEEECNGNGVPDECDLATGSSADCNGNGIPDECEEECNGNGVPDECDLASGFSADCNGNSVPDECDPDCDANGVPDECDLAMGGDVDCNENGRIDACEVDLADCDGNGVPDVCEVDCNGNGLPDAMDLAAGTSVDANGNGTPDECDLPLSGTRTTLSISQGGCLELTLDPPFPAGSKFFSLLMSASGTAPGFSLNGVHVPLNPDWTTFNLLSSPGGLDVTPALGGFAADPTPQVQVQLPPGSDPTWIGLTAHFAFVVQDVPGPLGGSTTSFASNAWPVTFLP